LCGGYGLPFLGSVIGPACLNILGRARPSMGRHTEQWTYIRITYIAYAPYCTILCRTESCCAFNEANSPGKIWYMFAGRKFQSFWFHRFPDHNFPLEDGNTSKDRGEPKAQCIRCVAITSVCGKMGFEGVTISCRSLVSQA
jgi:hypothetical protein